MTRENCLPNENTCCMFRSKMASFSLVEMLVVMVLSSIIVGIIYFSFSTISSYERRLSRQKKAVEGLETFYYILKKDLQQSNQIAALNRDELRCGYHSGNTIEYRFFPDLVVRTQLSRTDTFASAFSAPVFLKAGKMISSYPDIIDELQLDAGGKEMPFRILLLKSYDAASLIDLTKPDSLP
jgi:prepilin-type N-terminal cleavage/methylation domain-containing protein